MMLGFKDNIKKYNRQSHSSLSLSIDGIYCNGYRSPSQSSPETCSLKSNTYDAITRSSKYHCNCHIIPETDSYLTPLQKKTLLLKDQKKEIRELEKSGKIKDEKIKKLEDQVTVLLKKSNEERKTLHFDEEENLGVGETNMISILYNKINENLAEIKDTMSSLSPYHHESQLISTPHKTKSQTRAVHCSNTRLNCSHVTSTSHVTTITDRLGTIQSDLVQLMASAQESRDQALVAGECRAADRAEHRALLGFLRDALYHYLQGLGKNGGIALPSDDVHYKALAAILKFTTEQRNSLKAFDF